MISWYHIWILHDITWCIETHLYNNIILVVIPRFWPSSFVYIHVWCWCYTVLISELPILAGVGSYSFLMTTLGQYTRARKWEAFWFTAAERWNNLETLRKKPVLPDLNKHVIGEKSHWNDLRAPIGNYSCRDMHDPMNPLVLGVICLRPQLGSMLRWPLVCLTWKH